MSRAFTKEPDGTEAVEELPERPIPEERNLVTQRGLRLIEQNIEQGQSALSNARAADDKTAVARAQRDLTYWTARRDSAELVHAQADQTQVRFGSCVKLENEQGQHKKLCIVGLDEADPAQGYLSYVSPVAVMLIGKEAGDEIELAGQAWEIISISAAE